MATFSTNQVRHLYVLKNFQEASSITSFKNAGETAVGATKDASDVFIKYIGMGGQVRTDLIPKSKILSATLLTKDKDRTPLKSVLVQLDPKVNVAPITSQDYILRIAFRQYFGMSDEDLYLKYGMVHAYANMSASVFYAKLAQSLAKNFSRELVKPLAFHLVVNSEDKGEVTATSKIKYDSSFKGAADFDATTDTYTGIVIKEVDQKDEWVLGTKEQTPVYFTVQPTTIMVSGDEVIWGKVTKVADDTSVDPKRYVGNGTKIADLEYFCMGERGDIYRNIAWPHSIQTTYLVDPNMKYNMIDIHYSWIGDNENVQKSEKTLSLAVPKVGATNSVSNVLTNKIIAAINTATGLSVATLDTSASA